MSEIPKILEESFKKRFYDSVKDFFEECILAGELKPYIVEIDKINYILESGRYKRDANGKLVKNVVKGVSLVSKEEWEKENYPFKKGADTNAILMRHFLADKFEEHTWYNIGIEWDLPNTVENSTTLREYFYLEKLNNKLDLQKIKISKEQSPRKLTDFVHERRILVPLEAVDGRINIKYEEDMKFDKELDKFSGVEGHLSATKGLLKIEGKKDKLIERVYELIKKI